MLDQKGRNGGYNFCKIVNKILRVFNEILLCRHAQGRNMLFCTRIRLFMPKEFAFCCPKIRQATNRSFKLSSKTKQVAIALNAKKNVQVPKKDLRDSFHLNGHTGFRILPRYSKFETSYIPWLFERGRGRNRNGLYIRREASIYADTPVHTVEISKKYIYISNFLKAFLSLNRNEW